MVAPRADLLAARLVCCLKVGMTAGVTEHWMVDKSVVVGPFEGWCFVGWAAVMVDSKIGWKVEHWAIFLRAG